MGTARPTSPQALQETDRFTRLDLQIRAHTQGVHDYIWLCKGFTTIFGCRNVMVVARGSRLYLVVLGSPAESSDRFLDANAKNSLHPSMVVNRLGCKGKG